MRPKHLWLVVLTALLFAVLSLAPAGEAEAATYRTQGYNQNWYTWTQSGLWQIWSSSANSWQSAGPPGPNDTAYIQCRLNLPVGVNASVATLYIGSANCTNGGTSGGWYFYPSRRHILRVYGNLTVSRDLYIVDDSLEVYAGANISVTGMFYVGLGSGYLTPSTTNQLYSCQYNNPRLIMSGGTITIRYGATYGNASHAGGLIFWPGSSENISNGHIHIHGWLVGADYTTYSRYWDLTGSSARIFLDGTTYPATQTTRVYCYNYNNGSRDLKLPSLVIDRPGGRRIAFSSHVQVDQDFILYNGIVQASTPVNLRFVGNLQSDWTSIGSSSYSGIVPDVNLKNGRILIRSSIFLPGFTVNNGNSLFDIQIDDTGVLMGYLQILDGRVWLSTGTLQIHGYLQVGQQNPPSGALPVFDMVNAGRVWLRGLLAGGLDGDFYFLPSARGTFNAGTMEVEGNFGVDNANFSAGGSNTIIMSGNVGGNSARSGTGGGGIPVKIWNNQVPAGKVNATCILNNFVVNKNGANPGNQVDILSDLEINGDLNLVQGILHGHPGWTVTLFGQWPTNPPLGSGQGFTGNTALEIQTPNRFVLPGGQGPIIRINKNDTPTGPTNDQDCVELGGNMNCYGMQIWDGRFNFMGFHLNVTGNFTVGSGNPPLDQGNQPTLEMLAATGAGRLTVNASSNADGIFLVYNHSITSIDSGLIDVEGDFKIDSSGFMPTSANVCRLVGDRGADCEIWSNKPPGSSILNFRNLVFMKTGTGAGNMVNMGSSVEVHGTFTMVSGRFNGSLASPFNSTQVLHIKGSPNAWAGTGGSYTNIHNPNGPPFSVMIDGLGDQTCFTGVINSPDVPPNITILKAYDPAGETVDMAGGVLHGSVVFLADGIVNVGNGALIAEEDLFIGSSQNNLGPEIEMHNLNSLVEVRRDLYFMAGSTEDITDGVLRVLGDIRINDNDSTDPLQNFDLFNLGTERTVVELTGSASGVAEVFRATPPPANSSRPLNLYDLIINKSSTTNLVEAYSDINVNGSFQVLCGTLDTPGGVLNIRGNWLTTTGGAYAPAANLSLNGTGNLQTISAQASLPNVRVDKPQSSPPGPNAAVLPPGGQAISQTFWVRRGIFRLNGGTITVNGDFVVGGVTVPLDSLATLEITQATGAGTLIVQHPIGSSGAGNFYFNGGHGESVNVDSGTIRCTGRFAVGEASFVTSGTNLVEMNGNRGSRGEMWNAAGPLKVANVLINKSGSIPGNQIDLISRLEISGDFHMLQGIFNTNNFPNITLDGNWIVASGCIFIPTVCSVEFTGASGAPIIINNESHTAPFYNLKITMPLDTDAVSYHSINSRTLQVNREMILFRGEFTIPGNVKLDVGSTSSSALLQIGDAGNGSAGGTLVMSAGSELVLSNNAAISVEANATGTLKLQGTAGNRVKVTSSSPGSNRYTCQIAGGFEARYYDFISPKGSGIEILQSANLGSDPNNLSDGTFDYPEVSGTLLNLSGMSNTGPLPLAVRNCAFLNSGAVGQARNVKGSTNWSAGSDMVYFLEATGGLAGENFDDDPGDASIQDGFIRWMVGTLDVSTGPASPDTRSILRQAGTAVIMQVRIRETSNRQGVDLQTLTFTDTGPVANITSAALYVDIDSNGSVGTGDILLDSGTYSGTPSTNTFGTTATTLRNIPAGTTTDFLLVYTFSASTPSPSVFQASLVQTSDVSGEVIVGSIRLPAEVTGTFPVESGILTVRSSGSYTLQAGPLNPPTGQIIQGMLDASIQQIEIVAGTEEDIHFSQMTFRLAGGNGATSAMLINVRLVEDQNNDGFFNMGETVLASMAAWTSTIPWTASFTGAPLLTVPAGQTRVLLLVCQVLADTAPSGPSGGETFTSSINASGDVLSTGAVSITALTPTGTFPVAGNTQTVTLQPSVLAVAGLENPGNRGIDKAWDDVTMVQLRVVGLGEDILISSIQFDNTGTCDPNAAVSGAELVLDGNGNGIFDQGETVLASTTTVGSFVQFNWASGSEPVLRSNWPVYWILAYDFNGSGANGQTLTVTIPFGGITGTGVTTAISGVTGLPFSGGTVTLLEGVGTLQAMLGSFTPAPSSVSRSAADYTMIQIRLRSGPNEPLLIQSLTITGSGTGDEAMDISQVTLILDVDGDGMRTAMDTLLGSGQFVVDDGTVTFAGGATTPLLAMDANKSVDLLVLYSFGGTASHGETFTTSINSPADVIAEGQVSFATITASGAFPISSAEMEVVIPGTLAVSMGPRNPQNTYERIGSERLAMLQINLGANENEDLRVTRIMVNAIGTGHDVNDIVAGSVRLYRDVDRNGILSSQDEEIEPVTYQNYPALPAGWGSFASDNGIVTFAHLDETITTNTSQLWLIVMDVANSASLGSTFSLEIHDNSDVDAVGVRSGEAANVIGAPAVGGTKTLVAWGTGGSISIFPGQNTPPPRNELPGATGVELAQLSLVASTVEDVRIKDIKVSHRGTGDAQVDISLVRLFRDTTGNGLLDPTDVLLGSGPYDLNGEVLFAFTHDEIIPANTEQNYLIVYDLSGTAAGGATFIAGIQANTHVNAEGFASFALITISGAPVDGSAMVIGITGSLIVSYGPNNPQAIYVAKPMTGVKMMHLSFRATSPEDIRIKSVSLHAGGSGDDAATISASLFADYNGNGVVDGGDHPVSVINQLFDADNGTVTFFNVDHMVTAGTTAHLILLYNFNIVPALHWGQTYEVRLIPSLDVSCEGATSANTLYSAGSMLFSIRAKIGYPPGYEKYLNLPGGSSGGGCFIATASFGTRHGAQVLALSAFRDRFLMTHAPGRWFVRTYYRLSPPVADYLREHDMARAGVRTALMPLAGWAAALTGASALPLVLALLALASGLFTVALLARRSLRLAKAK